MTKTSATHFTVERATFDDAEGILDCLSAAFEPYRAQYTPAAYEDTVLTRETVRQRMQTMTVLVARDEAGLIIGTISGAAHAAEGHIRGMAVAPSWQGTTVADVLLHGIENEMRVAGCSFVTLDTTARLCARSGSMNEMAMFAQVLSRISSVWRCMSTGSNCKPDNAAGP